MLHACPGHYEHTPLCQVRVKDILPHTDVRQLMTIKEINLLIEIDRPDVSCKKRYWIFMQIFMTVCI